MWIGFIWLKIWTSNVMSFGVPQGIWLAEKLLAYQEGLRPMELVYSEKWRRTCPKYSSRMHTTRRRMGSVGTHNTTHSYPRPGIEENGLALWPDRRLLNSMGGHQSRSADGICRQPNGLSLLVELFWYRRRMLLPGWSCASRGTGAQG